MELEKWKKNGWNVYLFDGEKSEFLINFKEFKDAEEFSLKHSKVDELYIVGKGDIAIYGIPVNKVDMISKFDGLFKSMDEVFGKMNRTFEHRTYCMSRAKKRYNAKASKL